MGAIGQGSGGVTGAVSASGLVTDRRFQPDAALALHTAGPGWYQLVCGQVLTGDCDPALDADCDSANGAIHRGAADLYPWGPLNQTDANCDGWPNSQFFAPPP